MLATVWGSIGYQVIGLVFAKENDEVGSSVTQGKLEATREKFVYSDDVRDPFRFQPHERRTQKTLSLPPQVTLPPPFRLAGIVAGRQSKTAMLEDRNGSIFFLSEGDSLPGLRVVRIAEKEVSYSYLKKKGEWRIE
ncbi:MAG: hypothetical protein WBD36_13955 [Bacteroidota bacterium]